MKDDLKFLKKFPKESNGLFIVYDLYTFDNLCRLLLKSDFDHEDALYFIIANCSLSAYVFQERIHNKRYKKLSAKDALPPEEASRKAKLIHDLKELSKIK